MRLLIDGYNLMFESIASRQKMGGKHALRQARGRLMQMVIELVDPLELQDTMIVFDAKDAPDHLPESYKHAGMQIVFARDWDSADELIQTEIRKHPTPKRLTVVSSDHAIHRKAIARGARVIDCSDWIDQQSDEQAHRKIQSEQAIENGPSSNDERQRELSQEEKQKWLKDFGF